MRKSILVSMTVLMAVMLVSIAVLAGGGANLPDVTYTMKVNPDSYAGETREELIVAAEAAGWKIDKQSKSTHVLYVDVTGKLRVNIVLNTCQNGSGRTDSGSYMTSIGYLGDKEGAHDKALRLAFARILKATKDKPAIARSICMYP